MERNEILDFINTGYKFDDLDEIKKAYAVSYGQYDAQEIAAIIKAKKPVLLKDRLIVGVYPSGLFVDANENKLRIERLVDGIVIEASLKGPASPEDGQGDALAIEGRADFLPDDKYAIYIDPLRVGPVFLPPHSVVVNFINRTPAQEKQKIVSDLMGANINIYTLEGDYIGNIFHELGHLLWRTRVRYEEKEQFNIAAKGVRSGAIFEFDWEKKDGEEIFCTIYKWWLRSLYINKSFYNILDHEEPFLLKALQGVFDRLSREKIIEDVWELTKNDVYAYLNPKLDITSGKYIRKKGAFDKIKNLEIPQGVLDDIESVKDDVLYVNLTKGEPVPVKGRKIDFDRCQLKSMQKASAYYGEYRKPVVYLDMDGVVADFAAGYKAKFDRNVFKDDDFTVQQFCATDPNFFRTLPELPKGRELYEQLKDKFNIVFLTTPMESMDYCKTDKIAWAKEHYPGVKTIIFSDNKAEFAAHEGAVLIDDMGHNLEPWTEAGGTALNFEKLSNDKILDKIDEVIHPKEKIKITGTTNTAPTQAQKESGNYRKGEAVFKGLKIKIENPAGSLRFGWNDEGVKWVQKMKAHYGYIVNGEDGPDGDKVDVFLNPGGTGSRAFVINQVDKSGLFDEHKIMLGYNNIIEAERAYLANYQKGWTGLGSIIQTNTKVLRDWLATGPHHEAFKL